MNKSQVRPGKALFLKELTIARSAGYWLNCILLPVLMVWTTVFLPIDTIQPLVSTAPEVAVFMTKITSQVFALIQPLWVFLLIWMFLSSEVFINEKIDGRLEMLLTTPLKLKEIWNSKRKALLALILPVTLLMTSVVFFLQRIIWEAELGINPAIQPATLTLAFLIAPMLAYCVGSLLGLVSFLVSNPAVLQSVNFAVVFLLGFGGNYFVSNLVNDSGKDLVSWPVVGIYAGIALAVWMLTWFLSKKLDKDYVISHMS
ncbi:MAG: hypothetical protein VB026_09195 [Anaerolineaceae bacterium]|nr:hypothetical protein [Anaerolineaceae bacterium]